MSAPTILFVSGWSWSTIPAGVQGVVIVPWFDSRAAFPVRPWFLPSGRPRSDDPSQLWLRQSEKSGEQGSYVPRSERAGSESEVGLGAGLPIGEAVRKRLEPESSAPIE